MSKEYIRPTVTQDAIGKCDPHDIYEHPAFGVVRLSHVHGGGDVLFGSDVPQMSRMRVSVHPAKLHRNLSRDWIHSSAMPVVEFDLTHSQFAEFITGVGKGEGTPVTLTCARTGKAEVIPGIERVETKMETFRKEIEESAKRTLEGLRNEVDRLNALIESGKTPKGELRDIAQRLSRTLSHAPSNIAFVVQSAEEALEKATATAKIEVEAFIGAKAHSLGLESIHQLARLEHKQEQPE